MRPFIAISLLFCFIVYHFGYHVFHKVYQYKIEKDWTERVYQEDFSNKKVMKIPMKLPYSFDEEGFQLTNIPFTKDGKAYRAIQKRFKDDTFELVYVPDMAKIKLEINTKQWILTILPENSSDSQNDQVISQTSLKDYIKPLFQFVFSKPSVNRMNWNSFFTCFWLETLIPFPSPPPRLV
ncbi:hypothetical protein [Cyclobacterium sp.]|uniref:hypothetical protein n=1 Tax=Cyclobacterium sp. TaxID=1966343 RepID=UPI0019AB0138|nr:hypothetical protein [Cyclobacterium sp.]MBD3627114.1 hypothetical protein [Cyclobacterium sp.]